MNKVLKSVLSYAILLISCTTSLASELSCPSLDAVKAHGITHVKLYPGYGYVACETSEFDTDKTWSLILDSIKAESEEMAIINGSRLLNRLTKAPELTTEDDEVICTYKKALEGVLIAAVRNDHFCNRV